MEHNSEQCWGNLGNIAKLKRWLDPALDVGGNTHTFADIITAVMAGEMQLWQGPKGAAVTLILSHPQKRLIHFFLAGGEMEQVLDFQDSVAAWGKAHGCTEMTLAGRVGWSRVLKPFGWERQGEFIGVSI